MAALKLGLIGCGRIAQLVHLNILTRLSGVELVALAEPDPSRRAEAHARAPGAVAMADYHDLLSLPSVEAVVIGLPTALHAEAAIAALEGGKHVYLEKPIATDLAQARGIVAAWRRAGVVGRIGFNYRLNPLYQAGARHIQSARLGELVAARSVFSSPVRVMPEWLQTRQGGGGALLEYASHHVDLVHYLFGKRVRDVFATLHSQHSEDDSVTLQLRLVDGLPVQSFFSTSAVDEDRFEIYGQGGKLSIDRYHSLNVNVTDPSIEYSRTRRLWRGLRSVVDSPFLLKRLRAPSLEPSYQASLSHFVKATRGDCPAGPDLWDGYRSLTVIAAAEESARTGRPVSLSDLGDEDPPR